MLTSHCQARGHGKTVHDTVGIHDRRAVGQLVTPAFRDLRTAQLSTVRESPRQKRAASNFSSTGGPCAPPCETLCMLGWMRAGGRWRSFGSKMGARPPDSSPDRGGCLRRQCQRLCVPRRPSTWRPRRARTFVRGGLSFFRNCASAPAQMLPPIRPPPRSACRPTLGWAVRQGLARKFRRRPCLCETYRARQRPRDPRQVALVVVNVSMCIGTAARLARAKAIIHVGAARSSR